MASIPAPRKLSNFPFTGVLTANMTFFVADPDTKQNWQITPAQIVEFAQTLMFPIQDTNLRIFSSLFASNTTVDASFNGQTLYYEGDTDVTFAFAQSTPDNWRVSVVNLSNTANVVFNYNGIPAVSAPANLSQGSLNFVKLGGTIVGD